MSKKKRKKINMREEGMKYRRRREMTRMRIDVGKECQKNDIERRMSKKWT